MPQFGAVSNYNLAQCHADLVTLFNEVIKTFDCKVQVGYRGIMEQNEAYRTGKSKLQFPASKHNQLPSMAADVYPFINNKLSVNPYQCYYFAGYVMAIARQLKAARAIDYDVIAGADWNNNNNTNDQTFNDICHFELK